LLCCIISSWEDYLLLVLACCWYFSFSRIFLFLLLLIISLFVIHPKQTNHRGLELLTDDDEPVYDDSNDSNHVRRAAMASKLRERIFLFRKMKQNMGRTALMLSGGGAQAMYHLGTVKALIDANLYHKIKVISGTSGGSIAAASFAMFTPEEISKDICLTTVATDFRLTGEMKQKNIRWFPKLTDMISHWMKHRVLVDSEVRIDHSYGSHCMTAKRKTVFGICYICANIWPNQLPIS
jgi:hypothetical protein